MEKIYNKMKDFSQRLLFLAQHKGFSINELERIIGASKGVLSRAIKNGTDIQLKWAIALAESFPEFSHTWLLTGEGSPFRKSEVVIDENTDMRATINTLMAFIREKDEQIYEQAIEIGRLRERLERQGGNADAADNTPAARAV